MQFTEIFYILKSSVNHASSAKQRINAMYVVHSLFYICWIQLQSWMVKYRLF